MYALPIIITILLQSLTSLEFNTWVIIAVLPILLGGFLSWLFHMFQAVLTEGPFSQGRDDFMKRWLKDKERAYIYVNLVVSTILLFIAATFLHEVILVVLFTIATLVGIIRMIEHVSEFYAEDIKQLKKEIDDEG